MWSVVYRHRRQVNPQPAEELTDDEFACYDANKFVMLVALTRKLIFGIIALKIYARRFRQTGSLTKSVTPPGIVIKDLSLTLIRSFG